MYFPKVISVCSKARTALVLSFLCSLAIPGFPQVEHRNTWKPVKTVEAAAPAPTRLAEREKEFNERNSPENVAKLAKDFFTLLNRAYRTGDADLDSIYISAFEKFDGKDYSGAIEGYRDFYLSRLRGKNAKGQDPSKRTFVEFFNEADRLMDDEMIIAVFDKPMPKEVQIGGTDSILNYYNAGKHNDHMVNLRLKNGAPGRINWVFQPDSITGPTVHLPTDRSFLANAYNKDMFFSPLLAEFVRSKDPKYLRKWADIIDDFLLNHRRDMAEAGLNLAVGWGGAGGPSFGHLLFALNSVPGAEKMINATTIIRLVKNGWLESLPLQVRGTRVGGPNRIMHMYGFQLVEAYMAFPELMTAPYLLRERRRSIESYARTCVNPDGTGIDYAPNYNKNYLIWPANDIKVYENLKPPPEWLTPEWKEELQWNQYSMARYLMRYFSPSGTQPGFKNADRDMRGDLHGPNGLLKKLFPKLMEEPESRKLSSVLSPPNPKNPSQSAGAVEYPDFSSESYPYGGYYFMRENWKPDAQFMYFNSYRPGASGNWRHNQNIYLDAFGQNMLIFYRWESPLLVDGAAQIYAAFGSLYPKKYLDDQNAVLYGKYGAHMAWNEPIKSRWHTSSLFDLAEGDIKEPYAEIYTDKPSVFIDDVSHFRQILFARSAGIWIVCDRIRGEKPHNYNLRWGLRPDRGVPEGWSSKGKKIDDDGDDGKASDSVATNPRGYSKQQIDINPEESSIKTRNPNYPNLSIYHSATADLKLTPGAIAQNTDKFGNAYMVGPEFKARGEVMVTSLLYPRRNMEKDLKGYKAFRQGDVSGFDAETDTGYRLSYRAGLKSTNMQAGDVSGAASVLLHVRGTDGISSGIALDCANFAVAGKKETPPSADFEYAISKDGRISFTPVYRPMDMVEILPAADKFIDSVEVSLKHSGTDTEIRYTLDGKEPSLESALYTVPFKINETTSIKARAFRRGLAKAAPTQDGTLSSSVHSALYTKTSCLPAMKDKAVSRKDGLLFKYYEDDWTISDMKLPVLEPVSSGIAKDIGDISALRNNQNSYAFVYEGFMEVPSTGIYTIHAPEEFVSSVANCGYDLRIFIDGIEWYPATRRHNYGNWTIALEKGPHKLQVRYIDQRRGDLQASKEGGKTPWVGEKPAVRISGAGNVATQIPAEWLSH